MRIFLLFTPLIWLGALAISHAQGVLPTAIRFADFFVNPIGPRGLEPTPALLRVNDQRVELIGFMVAQEDMPAGYFLLTPRPLRLSEHADGDADDLPANTLAVILPPADQQMLVKHSVKPMKLTGTLKLGYYELPDGRIVWVRLLLDAPKLK